MRFRDLVASASIFMMTTGAAFAHGHHHHHWCDPGGGDGSGSGSGSGGGVAAPEIDPTWLGATLAILFTIGLIMRERNRREAMPSA